MSDEEHEHQQVVQQLPTWRASPWDFVGIAFTTAAGVATVLGQGLNQVTQECWAHARWLRERQEAEEAWLVEEAERQEMAEAYERLVGLDDHWIEPTEEDPT